MSNQKGISLIQMALALVGAGLLVAGILVGRSLISGAEVQGMVKQMQEIASATELFKQKYNAVPGDTSKVFPPGDGDHKVESGGSDKNDLGDVFSGEVANYWVHLSRVKTLRVPGEFSSEIKGGKLTVGKGGGANLPESPMSKVRGAGVVATYNNGDLAPYQITSAYIFGDYSKNDGTDLRFGKQGQNQQVYVGDAYVPSDVLSLDKKIDDGKAQKGMMVSFSKDGKCFNGDSYNSDISTGSCSFAIAESSVAGSIDGNEYTASTSTSTSTSTSSGTTLSCASGQYQCDISGSKWCCPDGQTCGPADGQCSPPEIVCSGTQKDCGTSPNRWCCGSSQICGDMQGQCKTEEVCESWEMQCTIGSNKWCCINNEQCGDTVGECKCPAPLHQCINGSDKWCCGGLEACGSNSFECAGTCDGVPCAQGTQEWCCPHGQTCGASFNQCDTGGCPSGNTTCQMWGMEWCCGQGESCDYDNMGCGGSSSGGCQMGEQNCGNDSYGNLVCCAPPYTCYTDYNNEPTCASSSGTSSGTSSSGCNISCSSCEMLDSVNCQCERMNLGCDPACTHPDYDICACVEFMPCHENCSDPGTCPDGTTWDSLLCACDGDGDCEEPSGGCPDGKTWDAEECECKGCRQHEIDWTGRSALDCIAICGAVVDNCCDVAGGIRARLSGVSPQKAMDDQCREGGHSGYDYGICDCY